MDNTEQAFAEIAAQMGTLRPHHSRLHRAAQGAGEFLLYLAALLLTALLFVGFGAAARVGWEWVG